MDARPAPAFFTVGHSTHPIERLLELLSANRIVQLADVRSFPSSRRWPQFDQQALASSLNDAGIAYRWMRALGGRRQSRRDDSPHQGWEVAAFRAYADYMDTADFSLALDELLEWGAAAPTCYLCSEGLWWRCHRRLISDALAVRRCVIQHIMPGGQLAPHKLTSFALVEGSTLTYPKPAT